MNNSEIYAQHAKKGPTHILGDLNAKIGTCTTQKEQHIVGPFTFDKQNAPALSTQSEPVQTNRRMLIDFCKDTDSRLTNTFFEKPNSKLATYTMPDDTLNKAAALERQGLDPYTRKLYDQIDFLITPQRWKNHILNCETDTNANIKADHFPLVVKYNYKLKYI